MPDKLIEMLGYSRPAGSQAEREFIKRYIAPIGARADGYGNRILRIGTAPIMWSAHTDTVHDRSGRQVVKTVGGKAIAPYSSCLGADDTTGVWLMLEMIEAGVPGLYVFHRGEEIGCVGSRWVVEHTPELVDGILAAIAFDRRGTDSIVTHQCGMRTCADSFAEDLATLLHAPMFPDPTGAFTDTVEYAALIPHCTNVSVGYFHQHTKDESQDLDFARFMRDALLNLDVDALVEAAKVDRGAGSYRRRRSSHWWDTADDMPEDAEYAEYDGKFALYGECELCGDWTDAIVETDGALLCDYCSVALKGA